MAKGLHSNQIETGVVTVVIGITLEYSHGIHSSGNKNNNIRWFLIVFQGADSHAVKFMLAIHHFPGNISADTQIFVRSAVSSSLTGYYLIAGCDKTQGHGATQAGQIIKGKFEVSSPGCLFHKDTVWCRPLCHSKWKRIMGLQIQKKLNAHRFFFDLEQRFKEQGRL
jgi:hypothetical protein